MTLPAYQQINQEEGQSQKQLEIATRRLTQISNTVVLVWSTISVSLSSLLAYLFIANYSSKEVAGVYGGFGFALNIIQLIPFCHLIYEVAIEKYKHYDLNRGLYLFGITYFSLFAFILIDNILLVCKVPSTKPFVIIYYIILSIIGLSTWKLSRNSTQVRFNNPGMLPEIVKFNNQKSISGYDLVADISHLLNYNLRISPKEITNAIDQSIQHLIEVYDEEFADLPEAFKRDSRSYSYDPEKLSKPKHTDEQYDADTYLTNSTLRDLLQGCLSFTISKNTATVTFSPFTPSTVKPETFNMLKAKLTEILENMDITIRDTVYHIKIEHNVDKLDLIWMELPYENLANCTGIFKEFLKSHHEIIYSRIPDFNNEGGPVNVSRVCAYYVVKLHGDEFEKETREILGKKYSVGLWKGRRVNPRVT
ncbi:Retrotransposon protein, putative [Candida maltosa Xu316]|uniref:Retrotransposon protein, putative n=1 Tax=Candida maltosa (strain Xu316) TaxID=1245528 RepID=M3JV96_CANMX|nr:Retrotransposon protein, putative [Candida maltosa Xu316]